MRVRINLSLSEAEYKQVDALRRAGRYKNACVFVRGLLLQVVRYAARRAQERAREPTQADPITEEIDTMFAELMDWSEAEPAQQRLAIAANEKTAND